METENPSPDKFVSIRKRFPGRNRFPIRKWGFLANIKEIKRLRGGDLQIAAQVNVQIDAEIGQEGHFRMKTNSY